VDINYRGKGKWFPAIVRKNRGNLTFDVVYDDGESELAVSLDRIKLQSGPDQLEKLNNGIVGLSVEVTRGGGPGWWSGTVIKDRGDGYVD
jgi:hypothetical protein